jgi:hypothetical protein
VAGSFPLLPSSSGQAAGVEKRPRKVDISVKPTDSTTVHMVKGLLLTLTAAQIATLVQNISTIDELHTGSACTGSNVVAMMLVTLFSVLNVGTLCDNYGCESALASAYMVVAREVCEQERAHSPAEFL